MDTCLRILLLTSPFLIVNAETVTSCYGNNNAIVECLLDNTGTCWTHISTARGEFKATEGGCSATRKPEGCEFAGEAGLRCYCNSSQNCNSAEHMANLARRHQQEGATVESSNIVTATESTAITECYTDKDTVEVCDSTETGACWRHITQLNGDFLAMSGGCASARTEPDGCFHSNPGLTCYCSTSNKCNTNLRAIEDAHRHKIENPNDDDEAITTTIKDSEPVSYTPESTSDYVPTGEYPRTPYVGTTPDPINKSNVNSCYTSLADSELCPVGKKGSCWRKITLDGSIAVSVGGCTETSNNQGCTADAGALVCYCNDGDLCNTDNRMVTIARAFQALFSAHPPATSPQPYVEPVQEGQQQHNHGRNHHHHGIQNRHHMQAPDAAAASGPSKTKYCYESASGSIQLCPLDRRAACSRTITTVNGEIRMLHGACESDDAASAHIGKCVEAEGGNLRCYCNSGDLCNSELKTKPIAKQYVKKAAPLGSGVGRVSRCYNSTFNINDCPQGKSSVCWRYITEGGRHMVAAGGGCEGGDRKEGCEQDENGSLRCFCSESDACNTNSRTVELAQRYRREQEVPDKGDDESSEEADRVTACYTMGLSSEECPAGRRHGCYRVVNEGTEAGSLLPEFGGCMKNTWAYREGCVKNRNAPGYTCFCGQSYCNSYATMMDAAKAFVDATTGNNNDD